MNPRVLFRKSAVDTGNALDKVGSLLADESVREVLMNDWSGDDFQGSWRIFAQNIARNGVQTQWNPGDLQGQNDQFRPGASLQAEKTSQECNFMLAGPTPGQCSCLQRVDWFSFPTKTLDHFWTMMVHAHKRGPHSSTQHTAVWNTQQCQSPGCRMGWVWGLTCVGRQDSVTREMQSNARRSVRHTKGGHK